ncbi:ATP-binding protein [Streptomyces sp. WMMC500]|uniref:sensor histidine kinase n=1 Tax=Streptomyces sp. WMMC500 TaxID=3015154 RepID=UPI00248CAF2F|nr:ATP-binding protein [Streptomyces sp. WMMC500]WBB61410.1 ATP-binding protein [Streptomyces sp. WMMC500]
MGPSRPHLAVLERVGAMSARLTPRRVRVRLTLLYGALFVLSGAVLLAITYLLVARPSGGLVAFKGVRHGPSSDRAEPRTYRLDEDLPGEESGVAEELRRHAMDQREAMLDRLLMQSGLALAVMSVIAIGLGWVIAGRVLRPLRTMTSTIRRISARNLHERLATGGPPDELKDLADTVNGLLGRLETALESQKRFVANAAHELRTPLTLEHALLEEALIDPGATLESFRANFERLLTISRQQAGLLESLLTLSSSDRGLDEAELLDLAALTHEVLPAFRPEIGRRELAVEPALEAARISGDSALVHRLVANLLDNAITYNVPRGTVEIATGVRDERAFLTVRNTGAAVPPDQVERLFHPFQRLRRAAGDGHHGLGLSIVRSIATAHGATLTAEAGPGGGLAVTVAFPPCEDGPGEHGRVAGFAKQGSAPAGL